MEHLESSAPTVGARTVAATDLSPDEFAAYEHLLPALAQAVREHEQVRRVSVHGGELLAFTGERMIAVRRRLFDYRVRWPRYRMLAYNTITEIRVESVGSSAKTITFALGPHRKVVRLFLPESEADRVAALVTSCLA